MKKQLLATVAAITSVLTPTVAEAGYTVEGIHLMDGSDFPGYERVATPMIETLADMGIPVVDGGKNDIEICIPKEKSMVMGFYIPSQNIMVICTDHGNVPMMMETLTHETVHVIQDARAGIDNGELGEAPVRHLQIMLNNIAPHKIDGIVELYEKEDYAVELEAFYFETKPQAVQQELTRWAF